jgi:hypothetical protein
MASPFPPNTIQGAFESMEEMYRQIGNPPPDSAVGQRFLVKNPQGSWEVFEVVH